MPNWLCPKCKSNNRPDGKFCGSCGEPRPKQAEPQSSGTGSGPPTTTPGSQGRSILDEIRSGFDGPFKQSRSLLGQFKADMPKLSDLNLELPDLDAMAREKPAVARVTTHNLQIQTRPHARLNYALAHCGAPLIPSLEIRNNAYEAAQDVLIKAWVATDYGEPWQKSVPAIPPRKSHVEEHIVVPLRKSRLQEVREAEKANLRVDVFTEGNLQISETYPLDVLPYNEWYYHPNIEGLVACFVQPNTDAIEKIISMVRDRLQREFRDTSLDGYQSGDPKKIVQMLEALYLTLQKDLQLSYINPPPSFEQPEILKDGGFTFSQKVFFPEQIYKHRRGTCLDLALLCAACVERMGLNPLCFLLRGHAFYGAWLVERSLQQAALTDYATMAQLVSQGAWLPLNSTTFAITPPRKFKDCLEEARHWLSNSEKFMCAVDVTSARREGFKPIPPMVIGPTIVAGPGLGGGYKE